MLNLVRHVPSGRWLQIYFDAGQVTPAEAYLPDLATQYALPVGELAVVSVTLLPADFLTNVVPQIPTPPTPQQQATTSFQGFKFPDAGQVDAAFDAVQAQIQTAANLADAKQAMAATLTLARRLAKLVFFLARATGVDS